MTPQYRLVQMWADLLKNKNIATNKNYGRQTRKWFEIPQCYIQGRCV